MLPTTLILGGLDVAAAPASLSRQQRLKQDQRKGGTRRRFARVPKQPGWHRPRFWVHIPSMAFASDIQLVRVTTDVIVDGIATKQLWAAAVPRRLAIGIVLDAIPEGWTAALSKKRLTPSEMALLKMRPGDVREWKKGDPTASALPLRTDKRARAGL